MAGFSGLGYGLANTVPGMLTAQRSEDEHMLDAIRQLAAKQKMEQEAQAFPLEQQALRARTAYLGAMSKYYTGGAGGSMGYNPVAEAFGTAVPEGAAGGITPRDLAVWSTAPPQSPMPGEQSMPASFSERFTGAADAPPAGLPGIMAVPPSASAGASGVPPTAQPGAGPGLRTPPGPARSPEEALPRLLADPAYMQATPKEKARRMEEFRAMANAQYKLRQEDLRKQGLKQSEKRLEATVEGRQQTAERLAAKALQSKHVALISAYGRLATINRDMITTAEGSPQRQQMQAAAAQVQAEINQLKGALGAPAQSLGPPPPGVRQKIGAAIALHKDDPAAVGAILQKGIQQGYDMSEFYTGGQAPPATPGPRSEIPSDAARFSELAPQGEGGSGVQLAMADDPRALGRPMFEVGGGRGGGATGGRPAPVTKSAPEILPPTREVIPQPTKLDWSEPLKQSGFPAAQLRAMSHPEIERAGRKVVETRLGPMLKPLIELGYTPMQVMRMTPAEAYNAIKGRVISAPGTPIGGSAGGL